MGREAAMWQGLRLKLMEAGLACRRLTERFDPGVPDVLWLHRASGVVGLLELKAVEDYPKTGRGVFDVGLSRAQSLWLRTWASENGRGSVLVRVTKPRHWLWWPAQHDPAWVTAMVDDPLTQYHVTFADPLPVKTLVQQLVNPYIPAQD